MRVGDLFAGIGGFSLAAHWAGWKTAWFSEIDPYCSRVLAKNFPDAPNLGDIRTITKDTAPPVDVLTGGFPCQDISLAGMGAGIHGERSGLWSEFARLIGELRPRWVVAENVSALRYRGLDVVLCDLVALGYDAEWHCIPASAVGAPHQRDRIWIIAAPADSGSLGGAPGVAGQDSWEEGDSRITHHLRASLRGGGARHPDEFRKSGQVTWWATEPNVGRVAHGVPHRVDRLRCLGNAIVPQVAHLIFEAINHVEAQR